MKQTKVDRFNQIAPPGSAVDVCLDDKSEIRTKTRSAAWLLGGHTPVVLVEGIAGGYLLDRVTPVVTLT